MDNDNEKTDVDKATGQPPPPQTPAQPPEPLTPLGAPVDPRFPPRDGKPQQENDVRKDQTEPASAPKPKTAKSAKKTPARRSAPKARKAAKKGRRR